MLEFCHKLFPHNFSSRLTEIYASLTIKSLTLGLVLIFEPIYLYIFFDKNAAAVLFFYGMASLGYGLLVPMGAWIMHRLGLKRSIMASYPALMFYYALLYSINSYPALIWVALAATILYRLLFWPAFHIDFSVYSDHSQRGREWGTFTLLIYISRIVSPALGGIILATAGFQALFLAVITLMIAATLPLFLSPDEKTRTSEGFLKTHRHLLEKKHLKDLIVFAAKGLEGGIQIFVWPVLLFTLGISFAQLGLLTTGAFMAGVLATLVTGELLDYSKSRRKILRRSSLILSFVHLAKAILVKGTMSAYIIDSLHKIVGPSGVTMSFQTIFYDKANESSMGVERYVIFHEIAVNLGKGLGFMVLGTLFTLGLISLPAMFVVAALLVYLFWLL